ncbi:response regulator [Sphingomonas sp.]|uniref:response regulator n=1 Tax=Sphingomonas sp. TaxID=28214 RepID=UPI0035C7ECB8
MTPSPAIATPRAAFGLAAVAGLVAALLVLWLVDSVAIGAGFLGAAVVIGGAVVARSALSRDPVAEAPTIDWSIVRAAVQAADDAVAVTDRAGRLVCANDIYEALFGGFPTPPGLPLDSGGVEALTTAGRQAWRDGYATSPAVRYRGAPLHVSVARAGETQDMLVWRFGESEASERTAAFIESLSGALGDRFAGAGIMAALVSADGRVLAANGVLHARAMGAGAGAISGRDFAALLVTDQHGRIRFEREWPGAGNPLRVIQIPFLDEPDAPLLVALLDEEEPQAITAAGTSHVRTLVGLLPFGMALVDRDGRFLKLNDAFVRAAGIDSAALPLYPGDLVVREDKAAVADTVRRLASGVQHTTDLVVRLKSHPEEPVALTIAGVRGLGEAAVLLSLKDNSEESRLKREVAQATKMQAVGQLAGGVAHDFNNILTAILGHCDLMLMRHSPGDSDYDDIQQIRANSTRAANLTRHLLAFSRQQTLRPQILQLPDVVSEVSNLLKRLLGERIVLDVRHGRNLGPVRADPGQMEQVVVNLAVNARDAMLAKDALGGGTLTIQTRAVSAAEVHRLDSDILPAADYTALEVSDTGTGIPPEVLPKIFEPFFTTKEVGKGTGLGLSTVYGIVKQSGGYIFAESPPGHGAVFTIYLPVHAAAPGEPAPRPAPKPKPAELWGTGTVLLVEDEDMVRAVAQRALSRQGYTVLTAENGEVALELLRSEPQPDLMISDVVMPLMDGPTVARHARALYPDLPILFMSGYADDQMRRSINLDRVAFLSKPFSVQQLAEAAREALAAV